MVRWCGIVLAAALLPAVAQAQNTTRVEPENLLPATTQVYVRWDGVEAHKAEYAKTALGKMLQGDTGKFLVGLFQQLQETLSTSLTEELLLRGETPDKLQKIQADAAEAPKLLSLFGDHGFVLGLEVKSLDPPSAQLTLIIPDAGDKPGPVFGSLRLLSILTKEEVKETKIDQRTVYHMQFNEVKVTWWVQGKHVVVVAGTETPEAAVKRVAAVNQEGRLGSAPLFKKVKEFDKFPTALRGFVDMAGLVKALKGNKDVAKLTTDLGLDGLRSVTFWSGFDDDTERSVVDFDMPGPRKGLLTVLAGKPFTLADVPPLPEDVISWRMLNLNAPALYDAVHLGAEDIVRLVDAKEAPRVEEFFKKIDDTLGVKLRDDLLVHLDGKVVLYNSPAEGPLMLGQALLFKVKDAKKLQEALDQAVKGLVKSTGADISVKKKTYRGAEIREVHVRENGFFFTPSYAIYKDWLVIGLYPQVVQGYILRANGELPAWKPNQRAQMSFDRLPKEFTMVSYSDPRPSIKQLFSIAPLIASLINSSTKDFRVDVGALPNGNEAAKDLFPNVTVLSDDGASARLETRSSLEIPLDLNGVDSYGFVLVAIFAFRIF